MRRLILVCIALLAYALAAVPARADLSEYETFGLESVSASLSVSEAGAHGDFTNALRLSGQGQLRNLAVELPPGLTGNPTAIPTCNSATFAASQDLPFGSTSPCAPDTQVGIVRTKIFSHPEVDEPLYNLQPPGGDVVARLGFWALLYPIYINIKVDPQRGYAVTATVENAPTSNFKLEATRATIWASPPDPIHNSERFLGPLEAQICGHACEPHPSGLSPIAFMSNPTHCGSLEVGVAASNYELPNRIVRVPAPLPDEITDCESVPFEPSLSLTPSSHQVDSPSGIDVDLTLPQGNITEPGGTRTSDLRAATVTLPKGLTLNASAADGLGACSEAEIGVTQVSPVLFNGSKASCPDSSKVGTVAITTPLLKEPLQGSLYVAQQGANPFGTLLAGYLVAEGQGVRIKQAARFDLDPSTGQITATVENAPQQPFSALAMHLIGGSRGVLQTPQACGTYASKYELIPWSGGLPVRGISSFTIDEGCTSGSFSPKLSAGVTNPVGGSYSPFTFDIAREDGEQNLAALDLTLPKGETAKLSGVALCPEALAPTGNCPATSQVGSVTAAVGSGATPLWVPQAGKSPTAVYLAGPYQGAPYSIVARVPAQAGPFDLGVVAVRSAIEVDPETAQVTVRSDPFPQILQGIPISYRRIHVSANRPKFSLNPTNCDPKSVSAAVVSASGGVYGASDRFQVGACGELAFKPKLSLRLTGGTRRGAHPSLQAVLKMKPGGANIARAQVSLPHSEFLENNHIKTVCTRVQFAAGKCPQGSIYGRARVVTPLLDQPLSGPVYLRSSSHKLPDLVADLNGQIQIVLDGRIDSINGGIRNTFEAVPDAPVSKFVLEMQGGKKGLLVNSTNLCQSASRATVRFNGQNGKTVDSSPVLANGCRGGVSARGR